jgi:hypothetical protein
LRFLNLRICIRTEGAATNQPRATPWETATRKGNALQGHNKAPCYALSGNAVKDFSQDFPA